MIRDEVTREERSGYKRREVVLHVCIYIPVQACLCTPCSFVDVGEGIANGGSHGVHWCRRGGERRQYEKILYKRREEPKRDNESDCTWLQEKGSRQCGVVGV